VDLRLALIGINYDRNHLSRGPAEK
jgi:hypothetical protein